jgi:hypothetical protein
MNQYSYYPGIGNISIDSNPQSAKVYIDGYALQDNAGNVLTTPVTVAGIMSGIHEIQISLDRYYDKKIFPDVIPGIVNKVFVKLIPI